MIARIDDKGRQHDLGYPWWVPVASKWTQIIVITAAAWQRDLLTPAHWAVIGIVLVLIPQVLQATMRTWVPWWFTAGFVMVGATLVMSQPLDHTADLAVVSFGFICAEVISTDGLRRGLPITALSIALVTDLSPMSSWASIGEVLVGVGVGVILRFQSRLLVAERSAVVQERAHAALDERQRIAREIHDLVAHSMSVTLLQLSGARRALLDDEVAEADAALADAERVGRTAMAEIRRAVGLLADGPGSLRPMPQGEDIETLVGSFREAGLKVNLEISGRVDTVRDAAGLALYRIVQESLSNVVKHAPGEEASVRIDVKETVVRTTVCNKLASASTHAPLTGVADGAGRGVMGMMARAESLGGHVTAGYDGATWRVEMVMEGT